MKIFSVALFFFGVCFAAAGLAGTIVTIDKPTSDGAIELSNLGSDDEAQTAGVPVNKGRGGSPDSESTTKNADVANDVNAPSPDVASQTADVSGDTDKAKAEAVALRASKYRDKMLNLPLLPNGQPANTAIQRRYLMVKKSDYMAGN